jgi:hypothetical protein
MSIVRRNGGMLKNTPALGNANKQYIPDIEAAAILGISVATLRRWRIIGGGPRWCKIGASVRYPVTDIHSYVAAQPGGGGTRAAA